MASPTSDEILIVADACLLHSHRLSEWIAKAPTMEEDVALGNIALDLLGQARGLFSQLGDEDELAYFRDSAQFRNPLICELPNRDFGNAMVRQLFVDAWLADLWPSWSDASEDIVRGVAQKAMKENAYHLRHSSGWVIRLGDGTAESHQRMQRAVLDLWPYRGELGATGWHERVTGILAEATLLAPPADAWSQSGGTSGRHTEHLSILLAEMQSLARAHPGAQW